MALTQIQTGMIADAAVTTAKIADANITTAKVADANITPAKLSQPLTQGTSQASTSGTSITFTGIPSWAKRITVMFNGVTTSATSNYLVQVGSGSVSNSGYSSSSVLANTAGTTNSGSTAGFISTSYGVAASGQFILSLIASNTWVCTGLVHGASPQSSVITTSGNGPALGGALDRVSITTVGGTATFTAGTINILYE